MSSKIPIFEPAEADIQKAVLEWLQYQPQTFAFRSNNIGVPFRKADGTQGFRPSPVKGLSDIICVHQGLFIALEAKRAGGVTSPSQEEFLNRVRHAGGVAEVVYSVEDVYQIFRRS